MMAPLYIQHMLYPQHKNYQENPWQTENLTNYILNNETFNEQLYKITSINSSILSTLLISHLNKWAKRFQNYHCITQLVLKQTPNQRFSRFPSNLKRLLIKHTVTILGQGKVSKTIGKIFQIHVYVLPNTAIFF